MDNTKVIDDWLENAQLICIKTGTKTKYNLTKSMFPLKFALKIYCRYYTLQKAEDGQQKLEILINKLNNDYNPRNQTKIK